MTQESPPSAHSAEQPGYTYYAFVSYSHKDEKWGKWIQNALEHYRLPAAVRKEVGKPLPEKIHPVFRDDTDLGACRLEAGLQQELEQSRFLIVVCSPNSAKPNTEGKHWVNEEVVRFCAMGRADRVIPVIVDGTAETAFCPKIAEEGLLGLDATKHPKARILNDLVAKILGLRPDELWRREERRLRAKRRLQASALLLAAAFVALGGFIWWDCTRTVVRAFADYVDSFGLPEGRTPLTPQQVAQRHIHYRFEFRGYRHGDSIHADSAAPSLLKSWGFRRVLRRVVQANSFGVPREVNIEAWRNRPVIIDCSGENDYRRDGSLQHYRIPSFGDRGEQFFSLEADHGRPNEIVIRKGAGDSSSRFTYMQGAMTRNDVFFEPVAGIAASTMNRIAKFETKRDELGRAVKIRFLADDGSPTSDVDGIFGMDMSLDDLGRVVEESYLSRKEDGSFFVRENRIGVARKQFTYDGDALHSIACFDSAGNPVPDETGICSIRFEIDEVGNVSSESHFDEEGNLAYDRMGIASLFFSYDGFGNMKSWENRDASGSLVYNTEGIARLVSQFDGNGNEIERAYFGTNGMPAVTSQGFSVVRFVRNQNGRITKMASFDGENNPVPGPEGQFSREDEYDANDRVVKMTYLDASGRPMCGLEGFATMTFAYDDGGNLLETAFFDDNGKPTLNKEGVHLNRFEWDEFGHGQKGHSYWGTNGLPTFSREGWHRVSYETRRGRVASETYFSTNGAQTLNARGFSRVTHKFDRMGNVTNEIYWAPDNSMTCCREGQAGWSAEYDDRGNGVWIGTFAPDGSLSDNGQGVTSIRRIYDKRGLMTDEIGLGKDGQAIKNTGGFARRHIEYDHLGHIAKETLFDENDKAVCAMGEACQTSYEYDRLGRNVTKTWTTVDGKLANNHHGFAEIQCEFDTLGRPLKTLYLDKNGKPTPGPEGVPEVIRCFDSAGHLVKMEFRDGHGTKMPNAAGIAGEEMEWDRFGNNTKTVFLGPTGGRVFCPQGFAEIRQEFDMRGNPVRESYFGPGGERVNGPWGVGETRFSHDSRRNRVWQGFFDFDGNPVDGTDGFSVMQMEYDSGNRQIRRSFHGASVLSEQILFLSKERRCEYDAKGFLVRETNLSGEGLPICGFDGWAQHIIENTPSGRPVKEYFLDEAGNRVCRADGAWEVAVEYWNDVAGNPKALETRADPNGSGLFAIPGLSIVRRDFAPDGTLQSERALQSDGRVFEDWPDTSALFVQAVQQGGQASRAGVQRGDILFAFGSNGLGYAVPLLFSAKLVAGGDSQEWNSFSSLMEALRNTKGATIVLARFEGGTFRFYDADFPDGDALDPNKEIVCGLSPFPEPQGWTLRNAYRRIVPHVPTCGEVFPDSAAAKAGVRAGDVILRIGDWNLSPRTQWTMFKQTLDTVSQKEKQLVVARKEEGTWRSLSFSFPSGSMGIQIMDATVLKRDLETLYALSSKRRDEGDNSPP